MGPRLFEIICLGKAKYVGREGWIDRMLIETVLSMQTVVNHFKKIGQRVWEYFRMRPAFTLAAFNVLAQWYGLPAREDGFVPLPIAEFSL